jgi:hypothetical protein
LLVTSADVIRVRLAHRELEDGSLPLEEGALFFQKAKDMMLAAACATAGPRAYFPSKKPNQAMDYLRKTRLGQTEPGSFVLTIISRVPPSLSASNGALFEMEEPFERRVALTLAQSLTAVGTAAASAASTGSVESFISAVPKGVSANLCDALVGMTGSLDSRRALEVAFSWSRNRPLSSDQSIPGKILIPPDAMPMIAEAGRYFKETSPREDFELRGPVVKLERAENAATGRVTVLGFVDDQPRKVTFELSEPNYHQAITAHKQEQTVVCYGVLLREGWAFRLSDPHDFSILEND